MNTLQTRNSYSEVFELLKHIDRNDLKRIPISLLEKIKENRNEQYIPNINFEDINGSISKKARALYIGLYLTYIVDSVEEKREINRILYNNEIEIKKELKINDNIFEKVSKDEQTKANNQLLVVKPNALKRLINKIKDFFRNKRKKI